MVMISPRAQGCVTYRIWVWCLWHELDVEIDLKICVCKVISLLECPSSIFQVSIVEGNWKGMFTTIREDSRLAPPHF